MQARIRLREKERTPALIDWALDRIARLLYHEGWLVRGETDASGEYVERLEAKAPRGFHTWDIRALATRGKLRLSVKNNALRVRYTPSIVGLLATAALVGYLSGWVIREIVEFGIPTQAASQWFDHSPWRWVMQAVAGLLFAYPLLRWRFTRMCRKALTLSDSAWNRYVSVAHMWRRASASAVLVVGPLVQSLVLWLGALSAAVHDVVLHGVGAVDARAIAWPTLRVAVLAAAVFFVDWDALVFEAPGRLLERWSRWRNPNQI